VQTHDVLAEALHGARGPYGAALALLDVAAIPDDAGSPLDDPDVRPDVEDLRAATANQFGEATDWPSAAERIGQLLLGDLQVGSAAYAVALGIDDAAHAGFSREWLLDRTAPFELRPGDRYPVQDMALAGLGKYSSRPHHRGMRSGDLPHLRRRPPGPEMVMVDPRFGDIVDGLLAGDEIRIAVVLPNADESELAMDGFPVEAIDTTLQVRRIVRSVERAVAQGCRVIVAPECAVPPQSLDELCGVISDASPPPVVFAGSSHQTLPGGERTNLAPVLLGGMREPAWTHRKMSRFESTRSGRTVSEDIVLEKPTRITVVTGAHVRIAAMICKDILDADRARLVGDLGIQLLGVPAMSATTDEFGPSAHELLARSQGIMVVSNNPHRWNSQPVAHGLMSRPVRSFTERVVPTHDAAPPGLAVGVLQQGWSPFITIDDDE